LPFLLKFTEAARAKALALGDGWTAQRVQQALWSAQVGASGTASSSRKARSKGSQRGQTKQKRKRKRQQGGKEPVTSYHCVCRLPFRSSHFAVRVQPHLALGAMVVQVVVQVVRVQVPVKPPPHHLPQQQRTPSRRVMLVRKDAVVVPACAVASSSSALVEGTRGRHIFKTQKFGTVGRCCWGCAHADKPLFLVTSRAWRSSTVSRMW